jgi:DNA polymerase
MTADTPLRQLIRNLCNTLDYLKASGCTGFDCSREGLEALARLGVARPAAPPGGESLLDIRDDLGACTRCPLSRGRTQIVFGEGAEHARLVFVGEGPGFEEDRSGRPFVGAAGALLDKIVSAMGVTRETVYIANIVKCRPPGNRNPTVDEIAACLPFLKRQLAAIRPQVICALGSVAARSLLETETPISRLRGQFHEVMGIAVMPTFHPAYLLRSPDRKRDVWHDMQLVMKRLA